MAAIPKRFPNAVRQLIGATHQGNQFLRTAAISRSVPTDYPPYEVPRGEPEDVKRKRLLYQSSTFADRYLNDMSSEQLDQYDILMNHPSNEWDIYYWATGRETTPSYYDNSIMDLLKKHTQNDSKETRFRQPDLN